LIHYKYSENEIKKIIKTLTIIVDSREKTNDHVLSYFRKQEVPYIIQKLDVGDYSFFIPANEEYGILRDLHFKSFVERKNSVDEICGNLQKDTQQAFINELTRSLGSRFVLFVEDENFDETIAQHNYRSQYDPKALKGRLESFKVKYNFEICPMHKKMIGHNILHRFLYQARYYLKYGEL